jgi:hypothetical protein
MLPNMSLRINKYVNKQTSNYRTKEQLSGTKSRLNYTLSF